LPSSSSSASAEVTRHITIRKSVPAVHTLNGLQGWRVRLTVTEAVEVAPEIFLYIKLPPALDKPDENRDRMVAVTSPQDLEEYPAGGPSTEEDFYRLHEADLLFRNQQFMNETIEKIFADVDQLVETLNLMDDLVDEEITFDGTLAHALG
jgi:hypothetical protein